MSNLQHCLHSVAFTWQLNWLVWGACEYPVNMQLGVCVLKCASNLLMRLLIMLYLLICPLQGICSLSFGSTTSLLCLCECEWLCVCVCVRVFVHLKCTQSFVVHLPRFYFKDQLMWPARTLCVYVCVLVCAVSF